MSKKIIIGIVVVVVIGVLIWYVGTLTTEKPVNLEKKLTKEEMESVVDTSVATLGWEDTEKKWQEIEDFARGYSVTSTTDTYEVSVLLSDTSMLPRETLALLTGNDNTTRETFMKDFCETLDKSKSEGMSYDLVTLKDFDVCYSFYPVGNVAPKPTYVSQVLIGHHEIKIVASSERKEAIPNSNDILEVFMNDMLNALRE